MDDEPMKDVEKIERLRRAMYSRSLSGKLHPRDRRELEPEHEIVGEDWMHEEPVLKASLVAPRGMSLMRNILWWILGVAVVFFVGAVGFFAYFFTYGAGSIPASPNNIDIVVSGPPQISGGEPTELQITVTNRNRVALELADLVITFPSGTRSPVNQADWPVLRQPLGTIPPGASRQGTVTALFAGKQGEHSNVKISLEYHLSGSNSIFTAETDYGLVFSSSPLTISVDSNTQTTSGQATIIQVTVSSNATTVLHDVLLNARYPFGFKPTQITPPPNGTLWQLGDLAPGAKKTITIQGVLTGETGDTRVFTFDAGTRASSTQSTIGTTLATNAFTMNISKPFLTISVSANDSTGQSVNVSPGDTVKGIIQYQNNLPTEITSVVIVAKLSGIAIDGTTVSTNEGFYRSSDNAMLWDKTSTNGMLATLAPGAKGKLAFSFKVPSSDSLKGVLNPHIDIAVNAGGNRVSETGVPEYLQSTATQRIALSSDLQILANGLYYSNPFGSTGPLPPKAETETTYALVLTVTNTTNKITGASVTATLPPYARWLGMYTPASENLTFNQIDSTFTWKLDDIMPGVGLNGLQPRQIAIAVGFTPSTSQIGRQPPLLQNITLKGTDSATGAPVTKTVSDITTNLIGDTNFNASNATVVK
jgi:hypothetical protein